MIQVFTAVHKTHGSPLPFGHRVIVGVANTPDRRQLLAMRNWATYCYLRRGH